MAISFFKKLEAFPPIRCRLLAVRYPKDSRYQWPIPLTDEEISQRSGLPVGEVKDISVLKSWDQVPTGKMRQFLLGCRLDLANWRAFSRTVRLAKREKFDYMRRDPKWQSHYEPLVKLWQYVRVQPAA